LTPSTRSATARTEAASSPVAPESRPSCFHCGLPAPGSRFSGAVSGAERDFCCAGCLAAAEAIAACGLDAYYRLRTAPAPTAAQGGEAEERLFAGEELQAAVVARRGELREVSLLIEGASCPACLWLNETRLSGLPGVVEAVGSYAGQSVRVRWDPARLELPDILAAVRRLGYRARPLDLRHRAAASTGSSEGGAARLVVAGVLGMVVMDLAVAAYVLGGAGPDGRLPLWEIFGRWCSLAASVVLLAHPGRDFFAGAIRDLSRRRAGMDVPIALGLAAAWCGSAAAVVRGSGPVYFDAIGMLVFFVLLARALETKARLAAAGALDRFAVVEPLTAVRVAPQGEQEVAAAALAPGDEILVRPGRPVPADGILLDGAALFDEAVLTGEPWPRPRKPGDAIAAGSSPRDAPARLRVTRSETDSTLAEIRRLLDRGLAGRPPFSELADRLAARLVGIVLLLAAGTAAFWLARSPSMALPATVAVLIVTCPCALALAAPVAATIAARRLARIGVLSTRPASLERLASADTAVFDKTGTLTLPAARLSGIVPFGSMSSSSALATAAALEASSEHPAARALVSAAEGRAPAADSVRERAGEGVEGRVSGRRWWIGSPAFASGSLPPPEDLAPLLAAARAEGRLVALLTDRSGSGALFTFEEELRPGAETIVAELARAGLPRATLLSGDAPEAVARLAAQLGFRDGFGGLTAAAKLDWIRARGAEGGRVLFVGDGLNDAPTLGAAATSVSFLEAPRLALLSSDFVLLGRSLAPLPAARRIARRARRVLAQNLSWALAYNLLSVPLAAVGLVPPWAAALGMSVSSLAVVGNALRLARPAPGEAVSGGGGRF
jgi:Cu2+-exporting ATPase